MTTLRFVDDRRTSSENEEEEEVVSKILYEEEAEGSTDPLLVRKRGLANNLRNQEGYLSTQFACRVILMKKKEKEKRDIGGAYRKIYPGEWVRLRGRATMEKLDCLLSILYKIPCT